MSIDNISHLRHGEAYSSEYKAWQSMKARCYNPLHKNFNSYGGRNIKVCDRWLDSFENFLEDMKYKPSPNHTLGRINPNGDYDPVNCQWQTWIKQGRHRANNKLKLSQAREIRMLYNRGYTQKELAEEFEISQGMISGIINKRYWKE